MECWHQMTGDGPADPLDQLADRSQLPVRPAEGEEPRLHGDQCLPHRTQRVEGQQPDRGRTVNQAAVIPSGVLFQQPGEPTIAVGQLVQATARSFQSREPDRARDEIEVARDLPDEFVRVEPVGAGPQQRLPQIAGNALFLHTQPDGAV